MKSAGEMLDGLRKKLFKNEYINETVIQALKDLTGENFNLNQIDIREETIFVKTNPVIKTQIVLNKNQVLSKINSTLGTKFQNIV